MEPVSVEVPMKAIAVFTNRGRDLLIAEGGSQAWKLKPERVKRLSYVLCVQNPADGDWGRPTHAQGTAFLLGKIADVVPAAGKRDAGRFMIRFASYAEINIPDFWQWRNPVHYVDLEDYGIDPSKLIFTPMRNRTVEALPVAGTQALDMTQAKKALAAFYKVEPEAIEIVIRG